MSLGHGASIVTTGLVFYYDMDNIQKSWKGAPATNLFTETNLNNWTKNAITSTSSYKTPFGDPSYDITDNSTTQYLSISRNITVPNDSSSYTISCMIRKTYGGTSARLGFNTGFNTGGTTVALNTRFNSDTGVANSGTVIDYGDWWYWYFTLTNNGTGNTNLYCQFYPATGVHNGSDNVVGVGTATIGSLMLVNGSTAIRFADGTRSNTQALLDLTGKNTITATSLAYASNNTFSFNGTNSGIVGSANASTLGITTDLTVSIFTKRQSSPTNVLQGQAGFGTGGSVSIKNSIAFFADINSATPTRYIVNITPGSTIAPYEDAWVNLCFTISGTSIKTYFNGVQNSSATMDTTVRPFGSEVFGLANGFGYFRMQGDLPVASVYNRALTANEVAQNFNALRGRYGI